MGTLTNIIKENYEKARKSVLDFSNTSKDFNDEKLRFNCNVKSALKANPELASYVKMLGEGTEYDVAKRFIFESFLGTVIEDIIRQYPRYGEKRVKELALEKIASKGFDMVDVEVSEEVKADIKRDIDLYFIYRNNHFYETYQIEEALHNSFGAARDAVAAIPGGVIDYTGEKVEQGKKYCRTKVRAGKRHFYNWLQDNE